jgi:2-polyprenyl-6-methoxyphenol hydroxylase-like FAD-dependent oxidoreductase
MRKAQLDLSRLENRFPYVLIVPQARTEMLLEARARALGVEIVRDAEVVGLRQDASGVELTVDGPDGAKARALRDLRPNGANLAMNSPASWKRRISATRSALEGG